MTGCRDSAQTEQSSSLLDRRRSRSQDRAPESSASTRSLAEDLLARGRTDARFPRKPGRAALFPGMPAEGGRRSTPRPPLLPRQGGHEGRRTILRLEILASQCVAGAACVRKDARRRRSRVSGRAESAMTESTETADAVRSQPLSSSWQSRGTVPAAAAEGLLVQRCRCLRRRCPHSRRRSPPTASSRRRSRSGAPRDRASCRR